MKVKSGTGKHFLKVLAERKFGKAFAYRKKQGFGIPISQWLKGPLRNMLRDVLTNQDAMHPLDSKIVKAALQNFLSDHRTAKNASRMWTLLMYGLWRMQPPA
jgi:asparagine synthase (glutamine-hydrolysing)